jgi:ABC-type multidrug transport system ATPase subunit
VDAAAQPMLVRRLIGYVPQLLSADASLTGRENVELFARLFDVPAAGLPAGGPGRPHGAADRGGPSPP